MDTLTHLFSYATKDIIPYSKLCTTERVHFRCRLKIMGEKIQRLKSCITDLRNKIEAAEEKNRRAAKALKIKQQKCEMLWEDATLKRRKLALMKEKLEKTYEVLDIKHLKLEHVDELLYTNAVIIKELTDMEVYNSQKRSSLEVALKKTRVKAKEFENRANDLETRAQFYNREIKIANFTKMKAQRKCADLESKLAAKKALLDRLHAQREEFHEREQNCIDQLHTLGEKIKEKTTKAEAAERRSYLLESKVLKLLQELYEQTGEAKKITVLKNELEDLSLN